MILAEDEQRGPAQAKVLVAIQPVAALALAKVGSTYYIELVFTSPPILPKFSWFP